MADYEFDTDDPIPLRFSKWLRWAIDQARIEKQTTLETRSGVSRQYINALLAAADKRTKKGKRSSEEKAKKLAHVIAKKTARHF